MAKRYPRTNKDFVIESIAGLKAIVQQQALAGFEPIADAVIFRRFFQLVTFLQDHHLSTRLLFEKQTQVTENSELRNSHLNDKGFYFLQYALGKWEDRLYKDQGEEMEWKFLERWHKAFLAKNPDLN
jgi:hypothetical protein